MYAAAGGASLASRQARQRQRQNKKNEQLAQLKTQQTQKLTAAGKSTAQGKQAQNLSSDYQSGVKLSRVERNALRPPVTTERRHSTSNHLKETTRARIRESPSILLPVQNHVSKQQHQSQLHLPTRGAQLLAAGSLAQNHVPPSPPLCALSTEPGAVFSHDPERRCSLVRQYEEAKDANPCDVANHVYCFEVRDKTTDGHPLMYTELDRTMFGSMDYPFSECSQGRAAWQERERERRCSLSEAAHNHRVKQTEAHHRWMKRNRIHDTSYGGSSDEEDFFSVYYQSAAANALLYAGLGTTVIGLVIWFVGTGEKGFKTLELRLIGPTLIAIGLLCCVVRVLLCICPSTCFRRRKKTRLKNTCPHRFNKEARREPPPPTEDFVLVDHSTALLTKSKKRVSIAPHPMPCASTSASTDPRVLLHQHQQPGGVPVHSCNDNVLAATTVFLQHEKERSVVPKPIPTIEIPDFAEFNSEARLPKGESFIELQNLELSSLEVSSVSSGDSDSITIIEAEITKTPLKLVRARQPKLTSKVGETSLSTATAPGVTSVAGSHSGIVLSPSKLGQ